MAKAHLMKDRWRWVTLSAIILSLGILWTFATRLPDGPSQHGSLGSCPREEFGAPDFTLDLLGGGQVSLIDLRGKVVLVNLWTSWCPPCRAEMPAIENIYCSLKTQGLEVLAINQTNQDSEAAAADFAQEFGLTFPIPLDRSGEISARYSLQGLPSSYFIDRQGVIRSVIVGGPMNAALIQSKVEELLKEVR